MPASGRVSVSVSEVTREFPALLVDQYAPRWDRNPVSRKYYPFRITEMSDLSALHFEKMLYTHVYAAEMHTIPRCETGLAHCPYNMGQWKARETTP